jgi:uncharacterized protein (TIGR02646 family)
MADIKQSIEYTDSQKKQIEVKLRDSSFTHNDWGEDDLINLRKEIREFYKKQQHGFCSYCKNTLSIQAVENCHVEHIAPKSKYRCFMFEPKNLCVICAECNKIKRQQETLDQEPDTVKRGSTRRLYPRSSNSFKIVHPHFDNYEDHIEIFGDYFYVDKTVKGGHTILYCKLNRRLHSFGWRREYIEDSAVIDMAGKLLAETDPSGQRRRIEEMAKLILLRR